MFDLVPLIAILRRYVPFVGRMREAIGMGMRREDTARLGPVSILLHQYLGRTMRRLAVLEAKLAAGTLVPDTPRTSTPTTTEGDAAPSGARLKLRLLMLTGFRAMHLMMPLQELVAAPETAALLAASPEAGRLIRPLWRMLMPDPMPAVLRLPPRPRKPRPPKLRAPQPTAWTPAYHLPPGPGIPRGPLTREQYFAIIRPNRKPRKTGLA